MKDNKIIATNSSKYSKNVGLGWNIAAINDKKKSYCVPLEGHFYGTV